MHWIRALREMGHQGVASFVIGSQPADKRVLFTLIPAQPLRGVVPKLNLLLSKQM